MGTKLTPELQEVKVWLWCVPHLQARWPEPLTPLSHLPPHSVQLRTSDVLLGSELLTRVMDKSKLKQALSQ